jgi:hypothetical protein
VTEWRWWWRLWQLTGSSWPTFWGILSEKHTLYSGGEGSCTSIAGGVLMHMVFRSYVRTLFVVTTVTTVALPGNSPNDGYSLLWFFFCRVLHWAYVPAFVHAGRGHTFNGTHSHVVSECTGICMPQTQQRYARHG